MTTPEQLLVTATELSEILEAEQDLPIGAPRTRVLDVRWSLQQPDGREPYREGHIPGAVYVDLDTELSTHGAATEGRHPLPNADTLSAAAQRWGLNQGDPVVAYDGAGNLSAARLWWVLRDAGVDNVRLLDGALPAWVEAGLPLETGDVTPEPSTITLKTGNMPRIELNDAGRFAEENLMLDARAAERYAGETEPIDPVAGHIPGAVNLPTVGNIDESGRFLAPERLRERFAAAGADTEKATKVGIYCGSGVTASHALFALALAGGEGALYPGSWSQWSNHPDLPVATGLAP